MSETTHQPFSCPACRIVDAADGAEDGQLFTVPRLEIGNERVILRSLQRAQDRTADQITTFAGSLNFVYLHSVWFLIWIAVNVGILGASAAFDPYPFGLLTMIVRLEAIFLSTFVMVSQNRQAKRSDIRSQIDFETNVRAEIWAIHIGAQLGVDHDHVEDVVRRSISAAEADH